MENKDQEQKEKYYLVKIKKFPVEVDYTKTFPESEEIEVYAVEENGILQTVYPGGKKIQDGTKNLSNPNIINIEQFLLNGEELLGVEKREVPIKKVSDFLAFPSYNQKRINSYKKILEYAESTIKYVKEESKKLVEAEKNFSEEINKGRK